MKKKIFAIAIAAVSLLTVSASAQTECKKDKCPATKENCDKTKKDCCKKTCTYNPFKGVEGISEEQQTKLNAISSPSVVLKEARQKGVGKDVNPREFVRTVRADYLKQVKGVLNPSQYQQFLENQYINQAPQQGGKPGKDGRHSKGGKPGKGHSPKGERK